MDKHLSFASYLEQRRLRKGEVGILVAHLRHDSSLPDIETWMQFEKYLISRESELREHTAAMTLWHSYKSWMRRRA